MLNAKKFILILAALFWVNHPCLPASSHHTSCKQSTHTTQKKHLKKKNKHQPLHPKKHKKKHHKRLPTHPKQYHAQIRSTNEVQANTPSFVASIGQSLVDFVQKSVDTFRYSAYKMGGSHFDTSHGIYIVDCSGYVDHTLKAVYPNAYFSLVDSSGSSKPNTMHYYDFFKGLSEKPDGYWSKVEEIEKLEPGDILVFRQKNSHRSAAGHVMVVMSKPMRDGDTYWVSVADSAPRGHSEDTRERHASGIGIGTLLLKVNPRTGQPSAYAWGAGSRWKNNVNFAMARPIDN